MTLNDPHTFSFKVAPFFDAEYLMNGSTYRHSFNEILIGTYTRPTQQCYFEWHWVIWSDLAKYSMTRSIARSLCDSWAFCYILAETKAIVFVFCVSRPDSTLQSLVYKLVPGVYRGKLANSFTAPLRYVVVDSFFGVSVRRVPLYSLMDCLQPVRVRRL